MSSIGASAMPWRAKYLHQPLDVLPDLQHRRVLEHRLQQRQRLRERHLALGRRVEEIAGARPGRDVPDRQVGRLAGPDREREPDQLRPHLVGRRGLGADAPRRRARGSRDPGGERLGVAQHDGARRVDRRQRHRLARGRRRRPLPRPRPSARSPAPRPRAWPRPGRTRARNSISPSKASSVVGVRVAHLQRRQRLLERHVAPERDERRARCGSGRRGRAAPRAASAA